MATLWITRFMDSLEILCGTRPPRDIVHAWLNTDCEKLQDWVGMRAHPLLHHTMNIAIIQAAMMLADQPVEGEDHEVRGEGQT